MTAAIFDVLAERERQDAKWGEQNHDDATWGLILGEEFGEACQAALEARFGDSGHPEANLREELVQLAAVAVSWVECIDRRAS